MVDTKRATAFRVPWRSIAKVTAIIGIATMIAWISGGTLTEAQRIVLGVLIAAAGLWVTEAIPPFATAITVIIVQVFLLGRPGGPLGLESEGLTKSYQIFLNPLASPTIILFFGGFILAAAATKHGLDRILAAAILRPFGSKPAFVLLGIILTTSVFSMFMSNTATAAMMIAIAAPLLKELKPSDPFRTALGLGIAFGANLGGMGTLIGTPPNAVAASILGSIGERITFLQWMTFGLPFSLLVVGILWLILCVWYKPLVSEVKPFAGAAQALTGDLVIVMVTFFVTIALWMTETLHGIPAPVAAMIPVLIFTTCGIIGSEDLKRIEWDVLILVAGGLSLGVALQASGLSAKFALLFPEGGAPIILLVGAAVATAILSNFMSNTSAANIMVPIVVALPGIPPQMAAAVIALAASLAMSLPISTPPNAILYATRTLETGDMLRVGTIISIVGLGILLAAAIVLS